MRSLFKVVPLVTLSLLVACGKKDSAKKANDADIVDQNETALADGSNVNGIYASQLYSVNTNFAHSIAGDAAVKREGDNLTAIVRVNYGSKNTVLRQAVYTGSECPSLKHDVNDDKWIDIVEAEAAIGKIILPLDGNIDTQTSGMNVYPIGDSMTGMYSYSISASFDRMLADLKTPDLIPSDNIMKLKEGQGITFQKRVVLIQGLAVDPLLPLPASVAGAHGLTAYQSLPIACGVLWTAAELPAVLR